MAETHAPRQIGDWVVPPIGFGSMLLCHPGRPNEVDATRTIHAALDGGARVIDTAFCYCASPEEMGFNERLVGNALRSWSGDRDSVLVVCKGGNLRTEDQPYIIDARP